jgi:hypothetical protein
MTVQELINRLLECDDDVLNYTVSVKLKTRLNNKVVLSTTEKLTSIEENVDVEREILFLNCGEK